MKKTYALVALFIALAGALYLGWVQATREISASATATSPSKGPQDGAVSKKAQSLMEKAPTSPATPVVLNPSQTEEWRKAQETVGNEVLARSIELNQSIHRRFFELHQVPPQLQTELVSIISKREADAVRNIMPPRFDAQGGVQMPDPQAMLKHREETQAMIGQLLGEELYGAYRDYSKTLAERILVNSMGKLSTEPLSPEQEETLVSVLFNHRSPPPLPGQSLPGQASPSEANQKINEEAAKILSAPQLEALNTALQNIAPPAIQPPAGQ